MLENHMLDYDEEDYSNTFGFGYIDEEDFNEEKED